MQPVRAWSSAEVYALHMPLYTGLGCGWPALVGGSRGCGRIALPSPALVYLQWLSHLSCVIL